MLVNTTARTSLLALIVAGLGAIVPGSSHPAVKVEASLGTPTVLAGGTQTAYLKVGLTGVAPAHAGQRPPVNLALVIDRSGSMAGAKIEKAKEAARQVVQKLSESDVLSVIIFDDQVDVVVPATRLTDKASAIAAIDRITARNSTALFAGVSRGAAEVRKFLDKEHINRIILVSDGDANVGPSTPAELGDLGSALKKEGMSVTTLGLGTDYNEDLMFKLAERSDGNHGFVESAADLERFFGLELGDVLAAVAKEVEVTVHFPAGVSPVRVLGREASIDGRVVTAAINQVYAGQEISMVIEVSIPAGEAGRSLSLADVDVSYANMDTRKTETQHEGASVRYAATQAEVETAMNAKAQTTIVELLAVEKSKQALALRDAGKIDEARRTLSENVKFLSENAVRFDAPALSSFSAAQAKDAAKLDSSDWMRERKEMRKWQQQNRPAAAW